MATAFNTPAGVQVATQLNWIASNAAYSLIKPTIDPNEAKVWGTQDVTGLMENLGGINYIEGVAYRDWETDRKSTRLNSSHSAKSRMPSSA